MKKKDVNKIPVEPDDVNVPIETEDDTDINAEEATHRDEANQYLRI